MDELSMTVFALVVLLAIDFPAVFLYTKAKTAWAFDCNLCLHNLKLSSFSQAVFFISTSAYFSDQYQKQLKIAQEEREILKKATTYFANEEG